MNNNKKRRAGAGLGRIFSDDNKDLFNEIISNTSKIAAKPEKLNLTLIKPNPYQPRRDFNDKALKELVVSIERDGLIQPIIINKKNFIIVGERRYQAVKKMGWKTIPVIRIDVDEKSMATIALAENLIREDINPIEEAVGYKRLIEIFGYTQQQVGDQFGKSRTYITNTLRLLKLPKQIIDLVIRKEITAGHARALLQIGDGDAIIKRAKEIVLKKIPVHKVVEKREVQKKEVHKKTQLNSVFIPTYKCNMLIKGKKIVLEFNNIKDRENFEQKLKKWSRS